MNNIEFGIQATIIGISAVFLVLMTVSFVMIALRRLESKIISRRERTTDQASVSAPGEPGSFDDLTTDEQLVAIAAVDAYRKEQVFSESEAIAAIGAVLEDHQHTSNNSDRSASGEDV
jgi:Na+-transporting methylmalonyl-CoA/oxaloacetate decarboxylase gamma subunit